MTSKNKSLQAKKYNQKPENGDEPYYEPERLAVALRRAGKTDDEIRTEVLAYIRSEQEKCASSFEYFASTYCYILGRGSLGIIRLVPEEYQIEAVKNILNNKYTIINKSRQLGLSTILAAYLVYASIYNAGQRTLLAAITLQVAKELLIKAKMYYEFLPPWLKPATTTYSNTEIVFENKSRFKCIAGTANAARSYAATVVLVDEAAFLENAADFFTAVLPTISGGDGKIAVISSPNGNSDHNEFYKICSGAKHGPNSALWNMWNYIEIPWYKCRDYTTDPLFKEKQLRRLNGNLTAFKAEYECSFDSYADSLFTNEAMNAFMPNKNILNAVSGMTYGDTLHIWETAKPGKEYVIGVDMSSNKSEAKDYTCMQVLERDTFVQVAEYMGKLPTEVFADILVKTARHYNGAQLVIESNSYSDSLFYILEQTGYDNLWYNEKGSKGFQTTSKTRPFLIEKLLLVYNNPTYMARLKSARLKSQFENFGYTKAYADGSRKIEAKKGNDDLVMALGICIAPLAIGMTRDILMPSSVNVAQTIYNPKNQSGEGMYTDEYIDYYSSKMGLTAPVLRNRLKMHHDWKAGKYSGTPMEKIDIPHPVESWEREQATVDFIGTKPAFTSVFEYVDSTLQENSVDLASVNKTAKFMDIFDDDIQEIHKFQASKLSKALFGFM